MIRETLPVAFPTYRALAQRAEHIILHAVFSSARKRNEPPKMYHMYHNPILFLYPVNIVSCLVGSKYMCSNLQLMMKCSVGSSHFIRRQRSAAMVQEIT